MRETVSSWMKTWGTVFGTGIGVLIQALILAILIPWVKDVNSVQAQLLSDVRESKTWMINHKEFVQRETENLKLTILSEVKFLIEENQKARQREFETLTRCFELTRESSARASMQVDFLSTRISELATRIGDLRSEFRQAFIDADFSKQETSKTKGP